MVPTLKVQCAAGREGNLVAPPLERSSIARASPWTAIAAIATRGEKATEIAPNRCRSADSGRDRRTYREKKGGRPLATLPSGPRHVASLYIAQPCDDTSRRGTRSATTRPPSPFATPVTELDAPPRRVTPVQQHPTVPTDDASAMPQRSLASAALGAPGAPCRMHFMGYAFVHDAGVAVARRLPSPELRPPVALWARAGLSSPPSQACLRGAAWPHQARGASP